MNIPQAWARVRNYEHYQELKKSLPALEAWTQQVGSVLLSQEESKRNLEEATVEVCVPEEDAMRLGNGVLITKNGYFLTANHNLTHDISRAFIRRNGRRYPLDYICMRGQKLDIALAKAYIPSPAAHYTYRIHDLQGFSRCNSYGVLLLTHTDGLLAPKGGYLRHALPGPSATIGLLSSQVPSARGDSGSPLVSCDGALLGIHSATAVLNTDRIRDSDKASVPITDAVRMVRQYIAARRQKYNL
jgi:S1-C subfamily serine protease